MPVGLYLRSFFLVITNSSVIIPATDVEYICILAVLAKLVPFSNSIACRSLPLVFFLVITNDSIIISTTEIEYIFTILAVLALVLFFLTHQEIRLDAIMAGIIVPLLWNMH